MEILPAESGRPAYLQLMADTKYGFQGWNGRGEISLIHASYYPDLYPEMTTHHIHAAIAVVRNGEEAQKLGDCYDHELIPVSGKPHKGSLPMTGSMFTVSDIKGVSPSGIRVTEDGSLILRFYNRTDEMKVTNIILPVDIAKASYVDLNQNEQAPVMMQGKRTMIFSIDAGATQTIKVVLDQALETFLEIRETEGENLHKNIQEKIENIKEYLKEIEKNSESDIKGYASKLEERILKFLNDNSVQIDEQRILTEVAIFADKVAIDEELVRLNSHFDAFNDIVSSNEPAGRKLDFLLQEMNRETNTIGSKASNTSTAHLVVNIKNELEKIREQIQNIE